MSNMRFVETVIVVALFGGYLALWRAKQARDIARTGVDPDVLAEASSPIQKYFARLVRAMTAFVLAMIGLHSLAPSSWSPLERVAAVDRWPFDVLGAAVGVAGLGTCALAQDRRPWRRVPRLCRADVAVPTLGVLTMETGQGVWRPAGEPVGT